MKQYPHLSLLAQGRLTLSRIFLSSVHSRFAPVLHLFFSTLPQASFVKSFMIFCDCAQRSTNQKIKIEINISSFIKIILPKNKFASLRQDCTKPKCLYFLLRKKLAMFFS